MRKAVLEHKNISSRRGTLKHPDLIPTISNKVKYPLLTIKSTRETYHITLTLQLHLVLSLFY
jgi:hypothetical protein